MGTDIHMIVQERRIGSDGPAWRDILTPAWWPRDKYDADRVAALTAKLPDPSAAQELTGVAGRWYWGRNYDLFAVLADVRNGYGFAGIQTLDTCWPSIAPNRGIPDDMAPIMDNDHTYSRDGVEVWLGDHSHTWMTWDEVRAYPWTETGRHYVGVVTLDAYLRRRGGGEAYQGWAGGITGPGIVTLERDAAEALLAGPGIVHDEGTRVHVRDRWPVTAAQACGEWHGTIMPAFERYLSEQFLAPTDLRLVMGFDS